MVDVNGKGSWKELPNFDNFEFSWKPVGSKNLNTTLNQVSEKLIKDKVINQMNIDHLSKRYEWRTNDEGQKELWHHVGETSGRTNVGAYMDVKDGWVKIEDGQVSENYMAMLTFFNTLMTNAGNNLDTFADVFSDWEDIDTWVEIAAENLNLETMIGITGNDIDTTGPSPEFTTPTTGAGQNLRRGGRIRKMKFGGKPKIRTKPVIKRRR